MSNTQAISEYLGMSESLLVYSLTVELDDNSKYFVWSIEDECRVSGTMDLNTLYGWANGYLYAKNHDE